MPTPFRTIYSTNITSDPETGIGRWSEQSFGQGWKERVFLSGGVDP
jgi:hypothetical protein